VTNRRITQGITRVRRRPIAAAARGGRLASATRLAPAPAGAGDPDFMESLARGLAVIRAFRDGRTRLSGAEVAGITGLSRAAARRCLHTLCVLGYARAEDGTYELTPAVLTLGHAYLGSASLAGIAQPILERVSEEIEEASAVAVLDGEEIVFVARAATRRILSVEVSVGSRLPAAATATGRVLLAAADDTTRAAFLAGATLSPHTRRTIVDRQSLAAELERVRTQGHAVVDQELEVGLRSLAVPVRRPDGVVVAALNVGVQAGRVDTRTMVKEFVPVLQRAAGEIGRALGAVVR
jgi:IclR family pca regulon transcriptional regulator